MGKKILVVDDESSIRELFEDILGSSGYEILTAEGAEQALDILQHENIGVIFLDLKLFGMNGIDLCRQIRKSNPVSMIYAMTGWAALYDIEECRESGFDDVFTKPVRTEVLLKAVEDAFEKLTRWRRSFSSGSLPLDAKA
jgi:CheY-like chemotaxis protein